MDNFDLKKYLVEGKLTQDKTQLNESVLGIAAGVILGFIGLKVIKSISRKVLGTIGANVTIEPSKLKSILNEIVKEAMSESGSMLGTDLMQIVFIKNKIESKIDSGEITNINGIINEFKSLTQG